jgi:hypothetical protein
VSPTDWFERRTFHHYDFSDADALLRAKESAGLSVSVCIPTLDEETTIGAVVRAVRSDLMDAVPLVDELVVIDSASSDGTIAAAEEAGATVHQDHEVHPELGALGGKGEALWKSLFVLRGDLIVWIDADIENFDPRFVRGILGPMLRDPGVGYVKSFYRRPLGPEAHGALEGGRVTELCARPLLNLFWPKLAGLIQPLSGEYGGRRELLAEVPFFTGYGVEFGLILDVASRFGVEAMAQVDMEERRHRNRTIPELSRMAYAILQVAARRLEGSGRLGTADREPPGLFQFEPENGSYRMESREVTVHERPPAASLEPYRRR